MNNIKYILWDIDGTLIDFEYAEKEGLRMCFEKYNLGDLTSEILERYKKINDSYWKRYEKGEITKKETLEGRFNDLFNIYGFDTSFVPTFNLDYQDNMGSVARFNGNAKEIILELKDKYKQYAVTNGTTKAQNKKLSITGLDKMLDDIFISEIIGFNKPSKEFFNTVFEKVGSKNMQDYIIIGDSLTSDILGGINSNIKTIWYNPSRKNNNYDFSPDYEIHELDEVLNILKLNNK